jgi:hypothetical protein
VIPASKVALAQGAWAPRGFYAAGRALRATLAVAQRSVVTDRESDPIHGDEELGLLVPLG